MVWKMIRFFAPRWNSIYCRDSIVLFHSWHDSTGIITLSHQFTILFFFTWHENVQILAHLHHLCLSYLFVLPDILRKHFMPLIVYLILQFAVTKLDGSQYSSNYFRTISISTTHIGSDGTKSYETKKIIPDDSIVKYTVHPRDGDNKISVMVKLCSYPSII